jgi:exopolysaccharide biosynthesis polyprenyl glycosylphosphotransferase
VTSVVSDRHPGRPVTGRVPAGSRRRRALQWEYRQRAALFVGDLVLILASTLIALLVRFGDNANSVHGVDYTVLSLVLVPVWLAVLVCARAYEMRFLGVGEDEYKRIVSASWWLMAVIAVVAYSFKIEFARGYVAVALPTGTMMLLAGRYAQRKWLHHRRRSGMCQHLVVAVGGLAAVQSFADSLAAKPYLGLRLAGVCLPTPGDITVVAGAPVLGSLTHVVLAVASSGADTVGVTVGPGMSAEVVRALSWELEGTGVDLVVAPALLDVAGLRSGARPAIDLPFVHIEEPELSGPRQMLKAGVEWVLAATALLIVAPFMVLIFLAIRLDSPGPVLFRQKRVGRRNAEFEVFKLRTMHADAESLLESLREANVNADGLLFKMRDDPRVTRVGRYLRRWSIDEIPQLWNVVRGDMALVGPRPPLPSEVSQYDREIARRLLVRPGITGLWQVSGRSDLSWEDSVRLDLYYVERWSLALDALIIWKTLFAVVERKGAY